jgi:hypothetical protein
MATKYYKCKIQTLALNKKGEPSPTKELYLIKADTHIEAETRIHTALKETHKNVEVFTIAPIILDTVKQHAEERADNWYLALLEIDTKEDKPKYKIKVMVNADTLQSCLDCVLKIYKNSIFEYEILEIKRTGVLNVFFDPMPMPF